MKPLRIMQLGPTLYKGGVAVSIKDLNVSLAQLGHQVLLLSNGGDNMERLEKAGVDYRYLDLDQRVASLWRAVRQVRRCVKEFQPDVIHVHGRYTGMLCSLAGRKADWFTLHSTKLTDRIGFWDAGPIRKFLSPIGRHQFVLDEKAIVYLTSRFNIPSDRIQLVTNGVDCVNYRPSNDNERREARAVFDLEAGQICVLFAGRFHEHKQPEAIVELAAAVKKAGLDHVRFAFVGEGHLEAMLRERIAGHDVGDICRIHGWMNALTAYWAADLVVMPSRIEGFAMSAAEALSCGCPVLRSRTGGFKRMIVEGVTGFGCETDVLDFVEKGLQVLQNSEQLPKMKDAAREIALKQLNVMRQAEQTAEAYLKFPGRRS